MILIWNCARTELTFRGDFLNNYFYFFLCKSVLFRELCALLAFFYNPEFVYFGRISLLYDDRIIEIYITGEGTVYISVVVHPWASACANNLVL
jgi:hypothetical protein